MEELTLFSISIRMVTLSSECLFFSTTLRLEYVLYYKTVSNQLGVTDSRCLPRPALEREREETSKYKASLG